METEVQKIAAKLTASKSAMRELSEGVASIRNRIKDLKAKRREISTRIVTKDIAVERLEEWFDARVGDAARIAPEVWQFVGAGDWSPPVAHFPDSLIAVLMLGLAPEAIASFKERVSQHYEDKQPMSEHERAANLALIDRQLLDAELAEENIIRAAEAEGFPIMRRSDADVFAVLAHDEVLA